MKNYKVSVAFSRKGIEDLKKQKHLLLLLIGAKVLPPDMESEIDGVLQLFDCLQDQLVDEHCIDKYKVFSLSKNDEEEKAMTKAFEKETKKLIKFISKSLKKV